MADNNNCGNCARGAKRLSEDDGHCLKCCTATKKNSYPGWQAPTLEEAAQEGGQ